MLVLNRGGSSSEAASSTPATSAPRTHTASASPPAAKPHVPARHATKPVNRPANPKLITRGVQRLLPRFLSHQIEAFTPHDLRRTGRTTLGRLGITPFAAERVLNHSKDVLQETYDLWDYFDEKRDALERLEKYLWALRIA